MLKKVIIYLGLVLCCFSIANAGDADLLDNVYENSVSNDTVVNVNGNGSDLLQGQDSTLMRVSKFLLKLNVVLGLSAFLYGGMAFMMAFGDDGKMKKSRSKLYISGSGIILALASGVIMALLSSASTTLVNGTQ